MATFTPEHKEEKSMNYFEVGVHKVKIKTVIFGETEDKKEFAEFTVYNDSGQEGTARLWFTTDKALGYSFGIVRGIFVHNASEDNRDKVRKTIDEIKDTKELETACQKLADKECWYEISEDPVRRYTNAKGEQRPSLNKNVYGYSPSPKTVTPISTDAAKEAGAEDVELSDIPF